MYMCVYVCIYIYIYIYIYTQTYINPSGGAAAPEGWEAPYYPTASDAW